MLHKLKHHAVPHAGVMVARAVLPVRHQIEQIVEAHFLGHALQNVDAEPIKAAVAGEILLRVHHDVGDLLDTDRISCACRATNIYVRGESSGGLGGAVSGREKFACGTEWTRTNPFLVGFTGAVSFIE